MVQSKSFANLGYPQPSAPKAGQALYKDPLKLVENKFF